MTSGILDRVWREQSVWSQVANRLKRDLERKRLLALSLAVLGAVASASAVVVGLNSGAGRSLAFASAASVAIAGIVRARAGKQTVQNWTRARSVSEAIKSEVYIYMAGLHDLGEGEREARLDEPVGEIEQDGSDLLQFKVGVAPLSRSLPPVDDVESYLHVRVASQIEQFYRPRALEIRRKVSRFRCIELVLAITGALLAAAAGVWKHVAIAVWVPVVTKVAAAITAHAAASRYDYLLVEYLRTAQELERLRDRRGSASRLSDEELVSKAEEVISVRNEGWMAKLASDDSVGAGG